MADTVLFAAPNAGGPELAARYDARVNSRRIAFSADLVPQVPCAPAEPACSGDLDGDFGHVVSPDLEGGAVLAVHERLKHQQRLPAACNTRTPASAPRLPRS